MKRVFIYSGLILMTLFAAVSCNDLDEIRESISDLQERVEALEQKMEENITALQSMVTLGSVASCEFQADSGKVVITLLDGQTLVIDQNVSGQALVSVRKGADGQYYWTVCNGDEASLLVVNGNNVPVVLTPQLKLSQTNEWQVSVDGGKTWHYTGVYLAESAEGADVIFYKDVALDGNYLVLTLADGTVIKVEVVGKPVFRSKVDTLWFAKESVEKIAPLELKKVKAYTITEKPEGWKAVIVSDTLHVTSPENISNAVKTGTVKVLGLFEDASSPEIISVEVVYEGGLTLVADINGNVTVNLPEHSADELSGYIICAWDASEYSSELVMEWLNSSEGYSSECRTASATYKLQDLVPDYAEDKAYVVFAIEYLPAMQVAQGEMKYELEDLLVAEIGSTDVRWRITDLGFDSATLNMVLTDMPSYYAGYSSVADWELHVQKDVLEAINKYRQYVPSTSPTYEGPVNAFPDSNAGKVLLPDTEYLVWILPEVEGYTYTSEDFILKTFRTKQIAHDSSIAEPSYEVSGLKSSGFTATVTPASGTYKTFASIMSSAAVPESDMELVTSLIQRNNCSFGSESLSVESYVFSPEEEVYLVAASLTEDGKFGKVLKKEVKLPGLAFSDALTVSVADVEYDLEGVTFKMSLGGNPSKISYFSASFVFNTESEIERLLALGQYGIAVTKSVAGSSAEIAISSGDLELGAESTLYVMTMDADGTPSHLFTHGFKYSLGISYLSSDHEDYEYGKPVLSGVKGAADGNFWSYYLSVAKPETCVKFWMVKAAPDYFPGYDDLLISDKIIASQVAGVEVYETSIDAQRYDYMTSSSLFYVVWLDDKGKYHTVYSFNPNK